MSSTLFLMGSAAEITEPTTGTEMHRPVELEEEGEQILDLKSKTSPFRHGKGIYNDGSTITSSSTSFSGDGPEEIPYFWNEEEESESGFHDGNNCNVYFNEEHGIWKCHHCDWTYRETKDSESASVESDAHESENEEKKQPELENAFSTFDESPEIEELKEGNFVKELDAVHQHPDDVIEEEVEIDAEDYDVEITLDKQETHDLFCPSCDSCITKRIVLKRRKRKIPHVLEDSKRLRVPLPSKAPALIQDGSEMSASLDKKHVDTSMIQDENSADTCKVVNHGATVEDGQKFLVVISSPPSVGINTPPVNSLEEGTLTEPLIIRPVDEGRKLEILKSIVYGGLTESIRALGVISSASASGASTLNILVLGITNILGGLILMIDHLYELRDEELIRITTNGQEEEGRYKRLLGRRENFTLHATVAILSFIIVGLIPPVVYFFSFSKTHNIDNKAASVLGSSLFCIVFLALAKARVKTPTESYLERILYYATIAAIMAWISYVAGNFLEQFFEKYEWSEGYETPAGEKMFSLVGRKAGSFWYSSSY